MRKAFGDIRADAALVEQTAAALHARRAGRGARAGAPRFARVAALCAVLLLTLGIGSYNLCFAAAAHVNIDINPSVELTLNRLDRVIGTYAFNREGERLLDEAGVGGKRYDEAAALLLAAGSNAGYFAAEDALVSVTVRADHAGREQALCDTLLRSVSGQIDAARATAEIEIYPVTEEVYSSAHSCHMSPARYLAIQELLAVDESATLEEYSEAGLHQIRQRTRACHEGHALAQDNPSGEGAAGQGSGQGGGQGGGHHGARAGHGTHAGG